MRGKIWQSSKEGINLLSTSQDHPSRNVVIAAWNVARKAIASPRLRGYRSRIFQAYVLVAFLAFSALALLANTTPYFRVDLLFTKEIQTETFPLFGTILQWVSWFGYDIQSITIVALVTVFLAVFGLRWEATTALLTAVLSTAMAFLIKIAIRRPRPTADLVHVFQTLNSYSFPSGHTIFYTAFFGFLLFLAFTMLKHTWQRAIPSIILGSLILLVGPSRMYLGEHWGSDVLAGYLLGSLFLILAIQFYHWGKKRFLIPQPVAPMAEGPDMGTTIKDVAEEVAGKKPKPSK